MSKMTLLFAATRHRLQLAVSGLRGLVPPALRLLVEDARQGADEETDYVDLLGYSSHRDGRAV